MSDFEYIKPKKEEYFTLLIISLVLSGLFSMSFFIFSNNLNFDFLEIFLKFSIFLFVLFLGRLLIMKFVGMRNAFEIEMELTYFNQFWFRKYDRLTHFEENIDKTAKFLGAKKKEESMFGIFGTKGIPVIFLSVFIYIVTLGFVLFPSVWKYKIKKIAHKHIGSMQYHEVGAVLFFRNIEISVYRVSKAIFAGFFYYFAFAMVFKALFENLFALYNWMIFILYWVAFFTLMPIPGTEGFEFFRTNRFAWFMAFSILVLGMVGILIFENYFFMFMTMVFCLIAIIFVMLWKKLME